MASGGLSEELSCSICLNIYKDPVMLTCGHNFCNDCIVSFYDSQQEVGIYTCPECRESFYKRPSLSKNLKLRNIVDHYRSTLQQLEEVKIFCTYCVDSVTPATKTCLHCEASLCDVHLKNHSKSSKHILIDPGTSVENVKCSGENVKCSVENVKCFVENVKCSVHAKQLQYFCYTDSSLMCSTCKLETKHKRHQVELLNEAFDKKKINLGNFLIKLTQKTGEYKNKLQQVQEQKQRVNGKADVMKERVSGLFEDIRLEMLTLENKVLQEISRQEEHISLPLSKQIESLDREIDGLQKKKIQVQQMCDVTDPITLLKQNVIDTNLGKQYFMTRPNSENFDEVSISVTLERALNSFTDILPKLKTNRGFAVNTVSDMILNVNTADVNIALSKNLKDASHTEQEKSRDHHPERFTTQQVLSINRFLSGKHYWEVNTSDSGGWSVGVTYNSIKRKNDTSYIGRNPKSWCLSWLDDKLIAEHDDESEDICDYTSNLGIYLDYEGGSLSFYELSGPVKHLHTFTTVFTEPLHAAVYLEDGACVKM